MTTAQAPQRLWEIDLLRTAAIAMMVVYHAAYNVDMLAAVPPIDPFSGGWRALQVMCGSTFLFVTGVTLAMGNARGRAAGLRGAALYRRHARRAGVVLAAALAVTVVTRIALGDDYIRFGVLHCIGAAMLLGPLVVRWGTWLLPLAGAVLAAGLVLRDLAPTDIPGLMVLGVPPAGGAGVDWYPLAPWLAPALLGIWAGSLLYPQGRRGAWGRRLPASPRGMGALTWPGRHSLPVYLAHQAVLVPLVAGALALAGVALTGDAFR